MSILIKGMRMPKNCMLCNFCVEEADPANGEMCLVTGKLMSPCNHERLDDCPLIEVSEDVQPVAHGWWKWSEGGQCSECGFHNSNFGYNYCPNCGAVMDGEA